MLNEMENEELTVCSPQKRSEGCQGRQGIRGRQCSCGMVWGASGYVAEGVFDTGADSDGYLGSERRIEGWEHDGELRSTSQLRGNGSENK